MGTEELPNFKMISLKNLSSRDADSGKRQATTDNKARGKTYQKGRKDNEKCPEKGRCKKNSMIPKPKINRIGSIVSGYQEPSRLSSRFPSSQIDEYENKLKALEAKEKSLTEHCSKIEELIQKMFSRKEIEKAKSLQSGPRNSFARKMTSDPQVFRSKTADSSLSEFESEVQEISDIWLKTSADLTNTLKILKSSPSVDPIQFDAESVKIQMAIKQAKSLTLVKTRNVIAEAKKLIDHREMIRTELENFLSSENLKMNKVEDTGESDRQSISLSGRVRKSKIGGTGDTPKEVPGVGRKNSETSTEEKEKCKEIQTINQNIVKSSPNLSAGEMQIWAAELAKKNETIAQLHKKIFELQKACSEHSVKYNQLQVKLAEFHEKIEWDQVLWKQIGKLKELIKGLQQNNKQLEAQKKELECKITKLDEEVQRLVKLNHLLNAQKYLMNSQEKNSEGSINLDEPDKTQDSNKSYNTSEKILAEKQNLINHLNNILTLMKDQENVAQKQIAAFQSKIEELKENSRT